MYYAVTKNKIYKSKNISILNKQLKAQIEPEEMKSLGKDYIAVLTDENLDFIQDKKRIQAVAINKLFKKTSTEKILLIIILLFNLIINIRI